MTNNSKTKIINLLKQLDGFTDMKSEDIANIAQNCRLHTYKQDDQIIRHLDETTDVFFLLSGSVRATLYSMSGKQVTFQDLKPGIMFGELAAIDKLPRANFVVANSEVEIAILDGDIFSDLIAKHPPLATITMQRLSGLVRFLCDKVFELSTLGVNNRIHAELLRLCETDNDDDVGLIDPVPTHAEIASRVSTHREAVTRELKRLQDTRLVLKEGKKLHVTSLDTLQKMVNDVIGTEK